MTENKPCYGSIVCHNPKDPLCASCPRLSECHDAVDQRLGMIRSMGDVERLIQRHRRNAVALGKKVEAKPDTRRVALTDKQKAIVAYERLPEDARMEVRRLFLKGVDGTHVRNALNNGANPFESDKKEWSLRAAAHYLGKSCFKRGDLARLFVKSGLSPDAKAAVKKETDAINTLAILGVIKFDSTTNTYRRL